MPQKLRPTTTVTLDFDDSDDDIFNEEVVHAGLLVLLSVLLM